MTAGNSTSPGRARHGRQLPFAAVLLGAVFLALTAALTIATLRGAADAGRHDAALVAGVEATVYEQTALELKGIAAGRLDAADAAQLAAARERLAALLDSLALDERASFGLPALRASVNSYRAALTEDIVALAGGDSAMAAAIEAVSVAPARESFDRIRASTQARLENAASDSATAADVGTFSALLSAAILVSLLFRRWERARRRSAFLVGERHGLVQSERRFKGLVQHSSDLVAVVSRDGRFAYVSPSAGRLLGVDPAALVGLPATDLIHPDDRVQLEALLAAPGDGLAGRVVEWRLRIGHEERLRRGWRTFESTVSAVDPDDGASAVIINSRDVTDRRALEATLRHQAGHDPLTDLLNRTVLIESMERALGRARRAETRVALLFVDLDSFKDINDTAGHLAGDKALVEIGKRLRRAVRSDEVVARLGGDEFAVLLENISEPEPAFGVAERLTEAIERPLLVDGAERRLTASIGVALSGEDLVAADDLLAAADQAMYAAKRAGGGRHVLFGGEASSARAAEQDVA